MKNLLYLYLFLLGVTSLAACGGDDPAPVAPEEPTPADTTQVDTPAVDTTAADTTVVDTTMRFYCEPTAIDEYQGARYYFDDYGNVFLPKFPFYDKRGELNVGMTTRNFGDTLFYKMECEGYISQRGALNPWYDRNIHYNMQRIPRNGVRVEDVEKGEEDVVLVNEEQNRQEVLMQTRMRIPTGCLIDNADRHNDSLSVAAFWPSANTYDLPGQGMVLSAAVAGVAVLPFGATFSEDVEVKLTMPLDVGLYGMEAISPAGATSVEADGQDITFFVRGGEEWIIMMDARIVSFETERLCVKNGTMHSSTERHTTGADKRKLYLATVHAEKHWGFENETELNFMEERYLRNLFGVHAKGEGRLHCRANHPFTLTYNIIQEVHHVTFEAGGRQFRVKIYGNAYMDILEAIPDEE